MNKQYIVLGLMSGTSLDGLDMALCRFEKRSDKWEYEVIAAETGKYPDALQSKLADAINLSAYDFVKLDVELAEIMASKINDFLARQTVKPDFIASHGHTTFHQPSIGLTVQIGKGATIAALTGIATVCDFRSLDVALGGQGAPLVPIGDELLFGHYSACLNLGGISNISFRKDGRRVAFDISPCNMALNFLAGKLGLPFDKDGLTAKSGYFNEKLFAKLNSLDYYKKTGAKSLGFEWFDSTFRPCMEAFELSTEDKLRTLVEHIAFQIAEVANAVEGETMLITGGGAKNSFLIDRLNGLCNKEIIVPDNQTVDFKEAIIFAFLGVLRMRGEANCLKDVTGAKSDNCGGAVYIPSI
ncbi:MAG: anhydro-N-acetylmuramic acid kinase [Dysgonamonadaceae bacterium]|jgi:anhydro-N-acetylmuramic acid kinase|nr:anhydro-N-acetylmuramic acid kinase [Dysgonamonadaceae bacterium]